MGPLAFTVGSRWSVLTSSWRYAVRSAQSHRVITTLRSIPRGPSLRGRPPVLRGRIAIGYTARFGLPRRLHRGLPGIARQESDDALKDGVHSRVNVPCEPRPKQRAHVLAEVNQLSLSLQIRLELGTGCGVAALRHVAAEAREHSARVDPTRLQRMPEIEEIASLLSLVQRPVASDAACRARCHPERRGRWPGRERRRVRPVPD